MTPKSIVYKVNLQISDMNRHYYQQHSLTLAKHPSETDERLMVRILAFAMYADETLAYGKGISEDEPALWRKDLTGTPDLWIEIGQPDERILRKACNLSSHVVLILYGAHTDLWWKHNQKALSKKENLTIIQLPYDITQSMAAIAERSMNLSCTLEDGQILLSCEKKTLTIEPIIILPQSC